MSAFKMNGQLTNSRTMTSALYANQVETRATDADDKELLFYNNGAPTSSANLTFDQMTNELTINGTLNGATGIIQDLTASNLSVSSLFTLPLSIVQSYPPLPVAGTNFTVVDAGSTGQSINLGGLKMVWGEAQFIRSALGSPGVFTVLNLGGIFTNTPVMTLTIAGVGIDTSQSVALNQNDENSFNFFLNDSDNNIGTSFIVSWIALGQ